MRVWKQIWVHWLIDALNCFKHLKFAHRLKKRGQGINWDIAVRIHEGILCQLHCGKYTKIRAHYKLRELLVCLLMRKHVEMKFSGGETLETCVLKEKDAPVDYFLIRCDGINHFYHCFRTLPPPCCGLAALAPTLSCYHFLVVLTTLWACAASHQRILPNSWRTAFINVTGLLPTVHLFLWCLTPVSIVPTATQGTFCDLCHLSRTYTVSLSRFLSLTFLLIWTT